MKRIFVGQFLHNNDAELEKRISQAANSYQNKVIEILKPDLSISVLPFFENTDSYFTNPDYKVELISRSQPYSNLWFSKVIKMCKDIRESYMIIAKSDIRTIWFYNVNITFLLLGLCLRIFNRKKSLFAIIADYDNSCKLIPTVIRFFIFNGLEGVVALSENIRHQNKVIIPGILFERDIIHRNQSILRKTVLMSGSLGRTTGFEFALNYFSKRKEYNLLITGKPYGYDDKDFDDLISFYVNRSSNIEFLGLVSLDKYYTLLSSCDIGISFRSPSDYEHNYNFPSKILEYLSCGLFVISTKKYTALDQEVYYFTEYDEDALDNVMSNIYSMSEIDVVNKRNYISSYLVNRFTEKVFNNSIVLIENNSHNHSQA